MISGNVKLKLKGYDSINDIQQFQNLFVLIEESQKKKREEGQFYYYELIDFDVYSGNDLIGKLTAFDNYGGGDLMNIRSSSGEEKYIPYHKDFIEKIDEKEKRIYVKVIEGLI